MTLNLTYEIRFWLVYNLEGIDIINKINGFLVNYVRYRNHSNGNDSGRKRAKTGFMTDMGFTLVDIRRDYKNWTFKKIVNEAADMFYCFCKYLTILNNSEYSSTFLTNVRFPFLTIHRLVLTQPCFFIYIDFMSMTCRILVLF